MALKDFSDGDGAEARLVLDAALVIDGIIHVVAGDPI
jgi:hypothetical protein